MNKLRIYSSNSLVVHTKWNSETRMRFDCGASNMDLLPRGYFRDEKPLRQLERTGTSESAFESRKRVARKYKSSAAVTLYFPASVIVKKVVLLKCENHEYQRRQRRNSGKCLVFVALLT